MSASASEDPDYELDAPWAIEEPAIAGQSVPSVREGRPPPGLPFRPAVGPSQAQQSNRVENRQPLVIEGHSHDLLGLESSENSSVDLSLAQTSTEGNVTAALNFPSHQPPGAATSTSRSVDGPRLQEPGQQEGAFHRPNILIQQEEDEDYHDDDHPTGFRRANEADLSERAGHPPDSVFSLPARRPIEFDIRFFGARNHNILHIARKTGTHISMPVDMGGQPLMHMWGTPERIQLARNDLNALYKQVDQECEQGVRRVGGWVKTRAMPTDRKQEIIDKMILDAKIRKLYRVPPPEGSSYSSVGIFIWPSKELNPQTVLGMAFEALDDIRFEHRVYILFDRKRNMFRILGDDSKNVESAVSRIFGTFCEVAAKNRRPTKMVLAQPPSMHLSATSVLFNQNHDLVNRQVTVKRVEENKGIQVFLGGSRPNREFLEAWKTRGESLKRANTEYLRMVLGQGLQDIAYYRGYARLRVYIGRMVLFGYKRPENTTHYDFVEFCEASCDPRTTGEVIRSIGSSKYGIKDKEAAEELIQNCGGRPDIFQPLDANPDLSDVQSLEPQISASFDLRLYGEKGFCQDIRLEVIFERLPGRRVYRPVHRRWLDGSADSKRAPESFNRRKGPLDIKIIDLEADLACQIEIATWKLYRETEHYPIFQEFISRLAVEEIPDEFHITGPPPLGQPDRRPKVQRVSFVNLPGLSVAGIVQKTKWRYWMGSTGYIFEVTRYENLPIHEVSTLYPDGVPVSYKGLDTPFDTRWGCCVWNDSWDNKLGQQAVAEIGNRGNWEPDVEKFFESSGTGGLDRRFGGWGDDGFAEFLGRIKEGVEVVKRAQENSALKKQPETDGPWRTNSAVSEWNGSEEFDL